MSKVLSAVPGISAFNKIFITHPNVSKKLPHMVYLSGWNMSIAEISSFVSVKSQQVWPPQKNVLKFPEFSKQLKSSV